VPQSYRLLLLVVPLQHYDGRLSRSIDVFACVRRWLTEQIDSSAGYPSAGRFVDAFAAPTGTQDVA